MPNEILYELPDGTPTYRGEKPPSDRELHRPPESGTFTGRYNNAAAEFEQGGE